MQIIAQVLAAEVITMAPSVSASVNFSHPQMASQQLIQTSQCLRYPHSFLFSVSNFSVRKYLTHRPPSVSDILSVFFFMTILDTLLSIKSDSGYEYIGHSGLVQCVFMGELAKTQYHNNFPIENPKIPQRFSVVSFCQLVPLQISKLNITTRLEGHYKYEYIHYEYENIHLRGPEQCMSHVTF